MSVMTNKVQLGSMEEVVRKSAMEFSGPGFEI